VLGRPPSLAEPPVEEERSVARGMIAAVRRRWLPVLVCLIAGPTITFAWASSRPERYEATASLLFRAPETKPSPLATTFFAEALDRNRRAATNLELVSLDDVARRAARKLGGGATRESVESNLKVSGEPQSDLISVTGRAETPQASARLANAVADAYIAFRTQADRARIREAQDLLRRRIASLTPTEQASARGARLRQRARSLDREQSIEAGDAEIVQPAEPPGAASTLSNKRLGAAGLLAGGALALLLVLALERANRRVGDGDEAIAVLGLPALAELRGKSRSEALWTGSLTWDQLIRASGDRRPRFAAVVAAPGDEPAPTLLRGLAEAARRDGVQPRIVEGSDLPGAPPAAATRLLELADDADLVLFLAAPLLVLELARLAPDELFVIVTARAGKTRYQAAEELHQALVAVRGLVLGVVIVADRRRWAALRVG
jgi:succinoglycan biosynthesis transport protein ExoP